MTKAKKIAAALCAAATLIIAGSVGFASSTANTSAAKASSAAAGYNGNLPKYDDTEYKRGLKTMTIPAHNGDSCRDVTVRCIKFVLPEDLDMPRTEDKGICRKRHFNARFIAHYIDNDFDCCDVLL